MPSTTKFADAVIGKRMLIATLLGAVGMSAHAVGQQTSRSMHAGSPVIAVTYDLERAKAAAIGGGFLLQGGGVAMPRISGRP
jgi:hypothetical protein